MTSSTGFGSGSDIISFHSLFLFEYNYHYDQCISRCDCNLIFLDFDRHVVLLDEYINFNSIPFIVELSLGDNFITGEGAIVLANNIRK